MSSLSSLSSLRVTPLPSPWNDKQTAWVNLQGSRLTPSLCWGQSSMAVLLGNALVVGSTVLSGQGTCLVSNFASYWREQRWDGSRLCAMFLCRLVLAAYIYANFSGQRSDWLDENGTPWVPYVLLDRRCCHADLWLLYQPPASLMSLQSSLAWGMHFCFS